MNVLLIDADSLMPRPPSMANLPLMKISHYHRKEGDKVFLNSGCNPDKVYMSCVFRRNRKFALGIAKMFNCEVEVGGYGIKREDYTPDYFREHDYYRFKVLRREGVRPYVMVYNDRRDIPVLRHFQRWVIMKLYQRFSWNEYDHGDSQKWIQKGFRAD